MGKLDNVIIFEDSMRLCKTNDRIKESVKKSIADQKLILENDKIGEINRTIYGEEAKVVVSKKRSLEAAAGYIGQRVAVHNFASATNPGGGVAKGASAQEECLCRISTLYPCLNEKYMWDNFYGSHRRTKNPLHNDDIIYTPNVLVFKEDVASPILMTDENWYEVDVITCAAPNLRKVPGNAYNPGDGDCAEVVSDDELGKIHEKRLRRMLDVAVANSVEVVILGAFGCGAFCNNPEVVARAANKVIEEYKYAFKTIEFAVYCREWDTENYRVFERVMGK